MAWNLGTTTVRNPRRIKDGLTLFAGEFNGNASGREREILLWHRLKMTDIVKDSGVTTEEPAVTPSDDINGRKWRACFYKMGFISADKYKAVEGTEVELSELKSEDLGLTGKPYEVTPIGRRLIEATSLGAIQDVFLRQLLRLEITSPLESEPPTVQIKPLVFVLQLLNELSIRSQPGLTREEIAAFVQTAVSHNGMTDLVDDIIVYREQRAQRTGRAAKRRFDKETIENARAANGLTVKPETLIDYADTTFRYLRMSGLFALDGRRLIIRNERRPAVDVILSSEPVFVAQTDPLQYLTQFYKGGSIPTDDADTALEEIRKYTELLLQHEVTPVAHADDLIGQPAHDIESARYAIQEQYKTDRERRFAQSHWDDDDTIIETLSYLKKLNGDRTIDVDIDEAPMFLEWAAWRGLLVFDSLAKRAEETRNFEIDEDMMPTRTASSGRADIVMDYQQFVLVTEVTMKTSSRQEAAEGEPVRRHVADVLTSTAAKDVYGLFIAPDIDYNTAETFRTGVWYNRDSVNFLNIVPIGLSAYIRIIESLISRRRTPVDFKALLDRCLVFRNVVAPQWLSKIEQEVDQWVASS